VGWEDSGVGWDSGESRTVEMVVRGEGGQWGGRKVRRAASEKRGQWGENTVQWGGRTVGREDSGRDNNVWREDSGEGGQ